MRHRLPWFAIIAAKLVLSILPVRRRHWQALGLFRLGQMDDAGYAVSVVTRLLDSAPIPRRGAGTLVLELGPGDSVGTALVGRALGWKGAILVDDSAAATRNMAVYRRMTDDLSARGMRVPSGVSFDSFESMLSSLGATYHTDGLRALRELPAEHCDVTMSNSVLEHVRTAEVSEVVAQLRRITKPGGMTIHTIDLKDHLGGALNNLRVSRRIWESRWWTRAGFYTNRILLGEWVQEFERAGFVVSICDSYRWSKLPTPRRAMAAEFRTLADEELLTKSFTLVGRLERNGG